MRPHKTEYWLFPRIDNWETFVKRVRLICSFIIQAVLLEMPNTHLISLDEKTGIQALERISGRAPRSKGEHLRKEFEYTRHGTTTLIAAINVENGKLVHTHSGPTRNEIDYAAFAKQVVSKLPELDNIILLADQLNTHLSESLVRWIADEHGYDQDELGIKGKKGILKNQQTRMAFLEIPEHRIRFIFTPKHCSWLNPIENWFAKLQRHVIKNGNFSSVKELEYKIEAYIAFYDKCLAKPLKWKFKGFEKARKLANLADQKLTT